MVSTAATATASRESHHKLHKRNKKTLWAMRNETEKKGAKTEMVDLLANAKFVTKDDLAWIRSRTAHRATSTNEKFIKIQRTSVGARKVVNGEKAEGHCVAVSTASINAPCCSRQFTRCVSTLACCRFALAFLCTPFYREKWSCWPQSAQQTHTGILISIKPKPKVNYRYGRTYEWWASFEGTKT